MKPFTIGFFEHMNPNGISGDSWRHPANTSTRFLDMDYWTELGKRLETANADFIFFADGYGIPAFSNSMVPAALRSAVEIPYADPFAVIPAIFAATKHLNVVVTTSTIFEEPYSNARKFATLDHVSKGRIGWNVVTSAAAASAAGLFGRELIPHDDRYDRADDYLDLSYKMFEGAWDDDALREDKKAGIYADPEKVHWIEHNGPYFKSKGVLAVPPSPQRTPFLFQAGSSDRGREFAAKHAECVFIQGTNSAQDAEVVTDIRRRANANGRNGNEIKIIVGLTVMIGDTAAAAEEKLAEFHSYATDDTAAAQFAHHTGIDLLSLDPEKPLPDLAAEQSQTQINRFRGKDGSPDRTVRQILEELKSRGIRGLVLSGTAEDVADGMESYAAATHVDGYLMETFVNPTTYDDILDRLLPVLRARGLAPTPYSTSTLRERFRGPGQHHLPNSHPGAAARFPR